MFEGYNESAGIKQKYYYKVGLGQREKPHFLLNLSFS